MSSDSLQQRWAHQALDALTDVFFVCDEDGTLLFCNESFRTTTGCTEDEIGGTHILDVFDAADKIRVGHAIETALSGGKATFAAHIAAQDGTRRRFEIAGSILIDDNGRRSVCGIGREASDRPMAEPLLACWAPKRPTTCCTAVC